LDYADVWRVCYATHFCVGPSLFKMSSFFYFIISLIHISCIVQKRVVPKPLRLYPPGERRARHGATV
jgi:hypothetical protein